MNTISIGIPVYNQVNTIADAIEAALAQTTSAMEIVVSENHSTDGTAEVVARYKDRIRIVHPPVHCSMAANWNFCVSSCKGDWVALCSGDDILLPEYVNQMSKGAMSDKDAVFVMGGWENKDEVTGKIAPNFLFSMNQITRVPKTIEMQLLGPKASFAAFCFKKSAYEKIGGFNETFHLIQDWMFQFDMSKLGSFIKVNHLVAQYRTFDRPASIEQYRSSLYIKDRIYYLDVKIWEALEYGISNKKVTEASKDLFNRLMDFMNEFNVKLDIDSENKLMGIANRIGMVKQFNQWLAGKWVVKKENQIPVLLKKCVRRILNVLH